MQNAAFVLTDQFAEVLERLPAGLDLDSLAVQTQAIQRRREVADGTGLSRLALARGPGGLSLRQTAAWALMLGIADLGNPGVKYRLDQATDFLAALVERLLAAKAPGPSCAGQAASCDSPAAPASASPAAVAPTGASTACSTSTAAASRLSN
jgi:hypothetical protein